jgi:hypothetical protein
MFLKGKRILFFSSKLFGIPENIAETLKKFGAIVDFYDERPSNTFIVKAMIRINRNFIASYVNKYHNQIINKTKDQHYDFIFFIKGESFSEHNLKKLFSLHSESKTIIYHWDSIANNRNLLNLLPYFDFAYSFDKYDCKRLNMTFLPLFYFDEYKSVASSKVEKKYDLLFVGTVHSDRYKLITSIVSQINALGGKCYTYFFFQSRIMFYKAKLQCKEMRNLSINDIQLTPMSKSQLFDLYRQSRIVVDIQHPKQTGLTLRCMEAVGAKKKLITTNVDIMNYDFYNSDNILVVDRHSPIVNKEFLNLEYKELPESIYEKYSISSWVKVIFGNT